MCDRLIEGGPEVEEVDRTEFGDDGGELVSAEAGGDAVPTAPSGEAFGGGGEDRVSGGVAVGVVDGLEVVFPDYAWIDFWGAAS
ncbi:hypothetical protein ADK33_07410 [Streptomyces griseus subsp. rhodochrous]|nr:hypothetical protein ADK33_07410 [Streptomyces griseus subsp. rhodochrous]